LGSRAEVMPALDRLFGQMTGDAQEVALKILAERLIGKTKIYLKVFRKSLEDMAINLLVAVLYPWDCWMYENPSFFQFQQVRSLLGPLRD